MNTANSPTALDDRWKAVQCLSPCEYWVFLKIGDGLTAREISELSGRKKSPKTIETQMSMTEHKLGFQKMSKLRAFAAQFVAHNGHPEITGRVIERRLILKAEKPTE